MAGTPPPPRDPRREADPIIYADPDVRGHKDLADDQCVVVARTVMLPLIRVSETGERIGEPSYPPALTVKLTIHEPRQDLQMLHSVLGAERIRDYLAYATGVRIPIRWVMASKRFLFPQEFIFDGQAYMPPELLIGRMDYSEWAGEIESGMVEAQRLLGIPEAGSPLDRAIDLVGRAITTDDRESCFLYCWRAIETVSAMDLAVSREAFKAGDVRAGDPYVSSQLLQFLRGEEEIQLGIGQRCFVSLQARVSGFDITKGREWYQLRGKVAHAGLSAEDYRDVLYGVPEILALAKACVASRLKEDDPGTGPAVTSG